MAQNLPYTTCARRAVPRNTCEDGLSLVWPVGSRLQHSAANVCLQFKLNFNSAHIVVAVDIIVTTRSALLQTDSLEPAAVLAASKSEKLTLDIFPDLEVNKDVHVTRLILMPHLLNKLELQEFVVDDLEKSFDNNKVQHENLGKTICSDRN